MVWGHNLNFFYLDFSTQQSTTQVIFVLFNSIHFVPSGWFKPEFFVKDIIRLSQTLLLERLTLIQICVRKKAQTTRACCVISSDKALAGSGTPRSGPSCCSSRFLSVTPGWQNQTWTSLPFPPVLFGAWDSDLDTSSCITLPAECGARLRAATLPDTCLQAPDKWNQYPCGAISPSAGWCCGGDASPSVELIMRQIARVHIQ